MVGVLLLFSLPQRHACPVSVASQTLVTLADLRLNVYEKQQWCDF